MPFDRNGRDVKVGTRIRILEIPPSLLANLPAEESQALSAMVGGVFEISEIDEHGVAWVEHHWPSRAEIEGNHSLALASQEMEVV